MNNKKIYSTSLVILLGIILIMTFKIHSLETNMETLIRNSSEQNQT